MGLINHSAGICSLQYYDGHWDEVGCRSLCGSWLFVDLNGPICIICGERRKLFAYDYRFVKKFECENITEFVKYVFSK